MTLETAQERQKLASLPGRSAWVTANAGSGKTHVLAERVLRLLLDGVAPEHILCLTYTKTAASEMQSRLFDRLGEWAVLPDDRLAELLRKLDVDLRHDPEAIDRARRLFATAADAPGGIRIQTIHAFCASILRRFPLEAGVSPDFTELDEVASAELKLRVVEDLVAGTGKEEFDRLAEYLDGEDDLIELLEEMTRRQPRQTGTRVEMARSPVQATPGAPTVNLDDDDTTHLIRRLSELLCLSGSKSDAKLGRLFAEAADISGAARLDALFRGFLTRDEDTGLRLKKRTVTSGFLSGPGAGLANAISDLAGRVELAARQADATAADAKYSAFEEFARIYRPAYETAKNNIGALDFDDLVARTEGLLSEPHVADWVMFQLDGAIEHILVDEAQDTSPTQWAVIERLAAEFFSGKSAVEKPRTVFVVGDPKQSIFSFQGADVAAFEAFRSRLQSMVERSAQRLQCIELQHSFRSSSAVLGVIDSTFRDPDSRGWTAQSEHVAVRSEAPGRVDLWEPVPDTEEASPQGLAPDDHVPRGESASRRLADAIARELRRLIDAGTIIPTREGPRPMHGGDVMILVKGRKSGLFHDIIRSCKAAGLPVAGADRLKLASEIAVRDLTALLQFLSLEADDLALATVLRSPLGGLDEDELYRLAATRGEDETLWSALLAARGRHPGVVDVLQDMKSCAESLRPYELLERILTRHHGRRLLLARLGAEAADGIDAILDRAITYEAAEVPTLMGFLALLSNPAHEITRQPEQGGRALRVMTVHGAKGLESPIVILADTTTSPGRRRRSSTVQAADGRLLWRVTKAAAPEVQRAADRLDDVRHREEDRRLLYVAMSRAESWLIVCGRGKAEKGSWYELVSRGLDERGRTDLEPPEGIAAAWRYSFEEWPEKPSVSGIETEGPVLRLPDWIDRPLLHSPSSNRSASPTGLGGAKSLAPGPETNEEGGAGLAFGTALHRCIQYLHSLPEDQRFSSVDAVVESVAGALTQEGRLALGDHARAVVTSPEISALVSDGALSEVEVCGPLPVQGAGPATGAIDLLHVGESRILVVDFKSNSVVPDRAEDVPEGILRQMASYEAILSNVYPGRLIELAIFWTATGSYMPLAPDIVRGSLMRATIP